jgi:hypothetical protein
MSLLTNEQIAELIGIVSNQSTSKDLYDEFHEWNKKQTGVQVNVDWQNAPKFADKAVLRLHWVTGGKGSELWTASEDAITFERPKPVITPHPHAEILAKYAEVAARRIDPWEEFSYRGKFNNWKSLGSNPNFHVDFEYCHIGETK